MLGQHPLAAYPLDVLARVCHRVAVVCKRETVVPAIEGAERWDEPDEPRHPLVGIVHALERAGEPVLVCAVDMPFVTTYACRELVAAAEAEAGRRGPATEKRAAATKSVVAVGAGGLEPLFGLYVPAALPALRAAPADAPLRATVESLDPVRVELPARLLRSVNTPADLAAAAASLGGPETLGG